MLRRCGVRRAVLDVLFDGHLFVTLTFMNDAYRGCEGRRRVKVRVSDRRSGAEDLISSECAGKIGGPRDLEAAFSLTVRTEARFWSRVQTVAELESGGIYGEGSDGRSSSNG